MESVAADWQTFSLGDLLKFSNGINAGKSAYGSGVPFANVLEVITHESLQAGDIPGRVNLPPKILARYKVQRGDILFNRTSETQDEVGLACVYLGHEPVVFGGFVFRGCPLTSDLDLGYSKYALRTAEVREQIIALGQGGIRANIGQRDLKGVTVTLPPVPEQQVIAEVLDDVSDHIKLLQRVITKKQAIKQGMMQQLVTGRTRLPGFSEQWMSTHVASKSVLKARIGWQGLTASEYRTSGRYRLVSGTEFADGSVDWNATPFVTKWRYEQDAGIQLRHGDVLLTKDGSIGKTAYVDTLPGPAALNSGVFVIRPIRDAYDSRFFYYTLRSRVFEEFLARLSAGSTISHLYQRDLVGLVLDMPPTVEEQRAIAAMLADVDDEISGSGRASTKHVESSRA